ncbi:prepilin-type N-terminal cleavage/methylation domain-containing protein [Sulfurimonas sp.]|uniref:type IV pilus modification PilV family protein n=1 Tax=Sulfurimonas sp. TaxID=2022749 RepID=UPI002601AD70|nr:prepilin-type N-terminal cleavage/methylation domain-containing protein [Sulfurimonas sp.]
MTKKSSRSAFTLIEVMVAVMIISVVIMALIRMYSNNTFLFSSYKKQSQANQYLSLLIGNKDYGFENKETYLYNLAQEFDMDKQLRRELKNQKVKVIYQELQTIDLSEDENASGTNIVLELGNSVLNFGESSAAMLRLRVQ